jgi:hypothetical protein
MKHTLLVILSCLALGLASCKKSATDNGIAILAGDRGSDLQAYPPAPLNQSMQPGSGQIQARELDVNFDGTIDFRFLVHNATLSGKTRRSECLLECLNGAEVVSIDTTIGFHLTPALDKSAFIANYFTFANGPVMLASSRRDTTGSLTLLRGNWKGVGERYIGFRLFRNNKYYPGWMQVRVDDYPSMMLMDHGVLK